MLALTRQCRGGRGEIVADDLAALHHELDPLQLADVRLRVARNGDEIGELALFDRPDPVLPAERFGVDHGAGLYGPGRGDAAALDQGLELEPLGPMREGAAIDAAARHELQSAG